MKKILVSAILIVVVVLAFFLFNSNKKETRVLENKVAPKSSVKSNMKITSPAFQNNTKISSKYTCDGENVNPQLDFDGVPQQAKSLVLIMDDPDAPSKTWVHWVVYNIKPQTLEVKEKSVPEGGIEGMTDFGNKGYGGPCPPSGVHRYFFKLYALNSILNLPQDSTKQMVEEKMQGHIIEKSELIGLYNRN